MGLSAQAGPEQDAGSAQVMGVARGHFCLRGTDLGSRACGLGQEMQKKGIWFSPWETILVREASYQREEHCQVVSLGISPP